MIEYTPNTFFGKIEFLEEIDRVKNKKNQPKRMGRFKCFCGNVFEKGINEVKTLNTTSCGCKITKNLKPELRGCTYTPEYHVWDNFKKRCTNPKTNNYHRYGGRGITVCKEWYIFENFINDMGKRPSDKHSIDRIDNDKGYYKENCKWSTKAEQVRNRSTNVFIDVKGKKMILEDIIIKAKIHHITMRNRLKKGMSIEEALKKPYKKQSYVSLF